MLRLKGLTTDGFTIEHWFTEGALLYFQRKKGAHLSPLLPFYSPTLVVSIKLVLPSDKTVAIPASYFNNCNASAVD
jgi:hypothetical protein